MKKKVIWIIFCIILLIVIAVTLQLTAKSNSEKNMNEQVLELIEESEEEYGHELAIATKEIENTLYGQWRVKDTEHGEHSNVGYNIMYRITGGHLVDAEISISPQQYREILNAVRDPIIEQYETPIFAYYTETLGEMAEDEMIYLGGIDGVSPEEQGIIVIAYGFEDDIHEYGEISSKYIIIEDYVIAFRSGSFYELVEVE